MAVPDSDITLGEIGRRLDRLEARMIDEVDRMVPRDVYEIRNGALEHQIGDLVVTYRAEQGYRRAMVLGIISAVLGSVGAVIAALVR